MIWLTWRQLRTSAIVAFGLLVAVALTAALTGPHLLHLYDTAVAHCGRYNDCGSAETEFLRNDHFLQAVLPPLLLVAPVLIGIFWGAPLLARELETGTSKLSWTQSVTRFRWLAAKLGLIGLTAIVLTGLLSLIIGWWFSPVDRVNLNRFTPAMFGVRGIAPFGYAAFAFMLGAVAGALVRRTLPAMAITIVGFIGVRFGVTYGLRPRFETPLGASSPLLLPVGTGPASVPVPLAVQPDSWILSETTINRSGQVIGQYGGIGQNGSLGLQVSPSGTVAIPGVGSCPGITMPHAAGAGHSLGGNGPAISSAFDSCARHFGLRDLVTYQPASRYWAFQCYETAIFLALAVALGALCFWWVRRRLT
jgi:hypothetical protein